MYIDGTYWNHYIGETDDSLTLAAYLADKQKTSISLSEIWSDLGLDRADGEFRRHEEPLTVELSCDGRKSDEPYAEFYYAIDIIADLAALLLECRINGGVNLQELSGCDLDTGPREICIVATPRELAQINHALADFVSEPLAFDLSEMLSEEDLKEMTEIFENLRNELFGEADAS